MCNSYELLLFPLPTQRRGSNRVKSRKIGGKLGSELPTFGKFWLAPRGSWFVADADKYVEAVLAGWRMVRLTEWQLDSGWVERILDFIIAVSTLDLV